MLSPCSRCARHVQVEDSACPFCGLSMHVSGGRHPRARALTRAAMFFLGATLAACDGAIDQEGEPEEPTTVQPYGAPPDPEPTPEPPPPDPTPDVVPSE